MEALQEVQKCLGGLGHDSTETFSIFEPLRLLLGPFQWPTNTIASFPGPRFIRLHEGKAATLPSCNQIKRGPGSEATNITALEQFTDIVSLAKLFCACTYYYTGTSVESVISVTVWLILSLFSEVNGTVNWPGIPLPQIHTGLPHPLLTTDHLASASTQ